MAVTPQKVQVSIVGGLDTKTDEKNVSGMSFLELENIKFTKTGSFTKRDGFDQLSRDVEQGSDIDAGTAITSFQGELLQFDGSKAYTRLEGQDMWKDLGPFSTSVASEVTLQGNGQPLQWADFYAGTDYTATISTTRAFGATPTTTTITISDTTTNQVISSFTFNSGTRICTLGFLNNRFYFFYGNAASNAPVVSYVDMSDPYTKSAEVGTTDQISSVFCGLNKLYYATVSGGGTNLYVMSADFSVSGPILISATSATMSMSEENQALRLVYKVGAAIYTELRQANGIAQLHVPVLIPTTINPNIYTATGFGTYSAIYFEDTSTNTDYVLKRVIVQSTGSLSAAVTLLASVGMASKASTIGSKAALFIYKKYNYHFDSQFLILDDLVATKPFITSQFGSRNAVKTDFLQSSNIPNSFYVNSTILGCAVVSVAVQNPQGAFITGACAVSRFSADFSQYTNYFDAAISKNLHMSGGVLRMYDGRALVEHGFLEIPPAGAELGAAPTVAGSLDVGTKPTSGGFGISPSGIYYVTYVYTYVDRNGQVHRSAPAIPWSVDCSAAGPWRFNHYIRIPTLTDKQIIEIQIYRTDANGSQYYNVTSLDTTSAKLFIDKDSNIGGFIGFADNVSIPSSPFKEPLYTDSGELEVDCANPSKYLTTFKNRIFLMSSDGTRLWYSKVNTLGTPVEFNNNLYIDLDGRGGAGTVIATMDSNLIIFKERSIFALSGDGPNNLGEQSDFRQPELISSDTGCTELNSIVLTPDGLMFKGEKGIYMLSRRMEVAYIGAPVERYNGDTITSAILCSKTNEVRFTLNSYRVLVYDYFHKYWTTFTNIQAIDSINHNNLYHYLRSDGRVCYETPGVYTDFGSFIKAYLKTAWIQLAGIQGYQRVFSFQFLGNYFSPHKLLAKFSYNYNPQQTSTATIDATSIMAASPYGAGPYGSGPYGGQYPTYAFEVATKQQKCASVQFSLEDVQDGTPGQSFSLSNIATEIGVLPGLNRTAKTNKAPAV